MDETSLQLWHWIRHDRSIAYCRIESVRVEPAGSDEQVHLRLRTLETLSGPPAIEPRAVTFAQPSSERARLKSKTPVSFGAPMVPLKLWNGSSGKSLLACSVYWVMTPLKRNVPGPMLRT